jgi:hypothetical protein
MGYFLGKHWDSQGCNSSLGECSLWVCAVKGGAFQWVQARRTYVRPAPDSSIGPKGSQRSAIALEPVPGAIRRFSMRWRGNADQAPLSATMTIM